MLSARVLRLFAILFLVFGLIAAITPPSASAAAQACPEGQELNDNGDCVEEENLQGINNLVLVQPTATSAPQRVNPTETPTPMNQLVAVPTNTPTPESPDRFTAAEPTETPDIGEPPVISGQVTLTKYGCPENWVPESGEFADYQEACITPLPDVAFSVLNGTDDVMAAGTTDDAGDLVLADITALDDLYLFETLPAGYPYQPITNCTWDGMSVLFPAIENPVSPSLDPAGPEAFLVRMLEFSEATFSLHCDVYNLHETAGPDGATLRLTKYLCESGWDPGGAYLDQYQQHCPTMQEGVQFDLIGDDDSPFDSGFTDAQGEVEFENLENISFRIAEHTPEFPPISVWTTCTTNPDGPPEPDQIEVVSLGSVYFTLADNEHLYCDVFNVQESGAGDFQDPTVNQESGTFFQLNKLFCAEHTGAQLYALDWYMDNCAEAGYAATFHIGDQTVELAGNDGIAIGMEDTSSVTFSEELTEGYAVPNVFCWIVDAAGVTVSGPDQLLPNPDGSWTATQAFGADHSITCYVINMPEYEPTITVVKLTCPPGIPLDLTQTEYEELCFYETDPITFNLSLDGAFVASQSIGEVQPNGVHFVMPTVTTGTWTLTEELPEGWNSPRVWCQAVSIDPNTDLGSFFEPAVNGSSVDINILLTEPGMQIFGGYYCSWVNFGTVEPSVEVLKYDCAGAHIWESATYTELTSWCDPVVSPDDYTFNLYGDLPAANTLLGTQTTGDVFPGGVRFLGAGDDANVFTIEEEVPPGFLEPIVFCEISGDGTVGVWFQQFPASDGAVQVDLTGTSMQPGFWGLTCHFFNVQDDDPDILIDKAICPAGTDPELSLTELLDQCEATSEPIPFHLSHDGNLIDTQTIGDVYEHGIFWAGYPDATGIWEIREEMPAGYTDAVVWCITSWDDDNVPSAWFDIPETDGAIEFTITDEQLLIDLAGVRCYWFNIESEDNTVTVHKWICPPWEEDQWSNKLDWLLENCTQVIADVEFTLDDLNGSSTKSTDASGAVMWTGVVSGPVTVTETIPPGYGEPIVWCGWTALHDGAIYDAFPSLQDTVNGAWHTSIDVPNSDVFCDWFNIPDDQPADIEVWKFWCPVGYDPSLPGADPITECTEPGEGIQFNLNDDSQITNNAGWLAWVDLAPGDYVLTEIAPPGTDYSFVWKCFGGRFPGIQPSPLSWEQSLNVNVASGDHIVCYWFNVPEDPAGSIEITKFWCSTEAFGSEVDCTVYEGGVTFELYSSPEDMLPNETTTDGFGKATFGDLEAGNYILREIGHEWCAISISNEGPEGSINVVAGEMTHVDVYNCTPPDGDKPEWEIPTKYPNTGTEPKVESLPATGTGAIAPTSSSSWYAELALLTLAGGCLALVLRRHQHG